MLLDASPFRPPADVFISVPTGAFVSKLGFCVLMGFS